MLQVKQLSVNLKMIRITQRLFSDQYTFKLEIPDRYLKTQHYLKIK